MRRAWTPGIMGLGLSITIIRSQRSAVNDSDRLFDNECERGDINGE